MARTYNKPPLIEAVCDFRFSSSQPWDWTIPGLFYEQIRSDFPNKNQLSTIETTVDAIEGRIVQQTQPKIQFTNGDRTAVLHVGPDSLTIHQLRPYPHIPDPIPQIFQGFLFNVDIPYNALQTGLRLTFATVVPEREAKLAYILDLAMYSANHAVPSTDTVPDWLESSHKHLEDAFEAAFTEKTHCEIFEEVRK